MRGIFVDRMLGSNEVIKALTLSDFTTWSSNAIINVIFTLFIIEKIPGAGVTEAGISSMVFLTVSAFLNIPFGRIMDGRKGFTDETYWLVISSLIRGFALILMGFSSTILHIYLLQAVLGISKAMNYTSWRTLFTKFLNTNKTGEQWGAYETVMSVGLGFAALIGGVLGDIIDFRYILMLAGIICIIGALFPLTVLQSVKRKVE